jgi:hypothetical protein
MCCLLASARWAATCLLVMISVPHEASQFFAALWLAPLLLQLHPLNPLALRLRLDAGLILLALAPLGMMKALAKVTTTRCLHHFGLNPLPIQLRCRQKWSRATA